MYKLDDNFYKRHTCIICKRKRYERNMTKVLVDSWACKDTYYFKYCCDNEEIRIAENMLIDFKKFKHVKIKHLTK